MSREAEYIVAVWVRKGDNVVPFPRQVPVSIPLADDEEIVPDMPAHAQPRFKGVAT